LDYNKRRGKERRFIIFSTVQFYHLQSFYADIEVFKISFAVADRSQRLTIVQIYVKKKVI